MAAQRLEIMKDRLQVPQGYKTPTAMLIELCGLKGMQVGGAKVNEPQPAIVLNANGLATAEDVITLYRNVVTAVFNATAVRLHMEPELIGFTAEEKRDILGLGSV